MFKSNQIIKFTCQSSPSSNKRGESGESLAGTSHSALKYKIIKFKHIENRA
jgi:hypothetical protein